MVTCRDAAAAALMQSGSQRRSSVPAKPGGGPSRPTSAAQLSVPFSPAGARTPPQDPSRPGAASLQQSRAFTSQHQRHSLMHVPLRPDSAAATEVSAAPMEENDADDAVSHAPQPSLAQTLANARAMLAGFPNISPPSTPRSHPQKADVDTSRPGRSASDDQATAFDHLEGDDDEDADEGDEDQNDDDSDDEGDIGTEDESQQASSRQMTQDNDEDAGPLHDVRMTRSWERQLFELNLRELQSHEHGASDSPPMPPPPPSAFLLGLAKNAGSATTSRQGSRRASASQDWDAHQSPSSSRPLPLSDNQSSLDEPAALSETDNGDPDAAASEDGVAWETRYLQLRQRAAGEGGQHNGQPAVVADQQAVTSQPDRAGAQPPAASRAPPPQPSITQLQNYSAPKPIHRAMPNAYADLAAAPSMDEEIDPTYGDSAPLLEAPGGMGDDDDAAADVDTADPSWSQPHGTSAESRPEASSQGPPLLDNLASSGADWDEDLAGSRELNSLDLHREDAALLDPLIAAEERATPRPATAPEKGTRRNKVSFLDASG